MESQKRFAEFHVHKSDLTGRPLVRAIVPKGTDLKDLVRVQEILYTDILEKIGLGAHDNCLSGLDGFILEERFEDIIRVGF